MTSTERGKPAKGPLYKVKNSPIHGTGVFARRAIRKGARILEYTGERISHEEADRRYDDSAGDYTHVVLFNLGDGTCIDGGAGGGPARFVNHACEPNCEARQVGSRIFLYALRALAPGEELTYDYRLDLEEGGLSAERERYACRCGAPSCRGTMLEK